MSTRTIRKIITSTNAPDAVTLTSLTRDDTSAEVQAANVNIAPVAFTLASTVGNVRTYEVTFTEPADGLSYHYLYEVVSGNDSVTDDGVLTYPVSGGATWTYSNETRFNLWNQKDATAIQDFGDSAVLQNAGQDGDAYINLGLRAIGFTVPLTGMDSITTTRLENVSNQGARWKLGEAQQWNVAQGQKPDDLVKATLRDQKAVDDFLAQVSKTPSMLVCDNVPSLGTSTGGISVSVKDPTQYPGTGCVRPTAITVPALASPRVW